MNTQPRILDADTLRQVLNQCGTPPREGEYQLTAIAHQFCLTVHELRNGGNQPRYVLPRHIAMYVLHEKFGYSLPHIGKIINRHHTSVLHGVRKIAASRLVSPELDAILREFEK